MSDVYDVIVAGLGPGGSTAAYRLARAGLKVLALEKKVMPRPKLCAGGLSPKAVALLDCDISDLVEKEVKGGIVYTHMGNDMEMYSDNDSGLIVDRARFDERLMRRAAKAGAQIHENEGVTHIIPGESIEVQTVSATYHTRHLIGADGANSVVARDLGYSMRHSGYALECLLPDSFDLVRENAGRLVLYYGFLPSGYGWIFPRRGCASVGIGVLGRHARDIRRLFQDFLKAIGLPEEIAASCKGYPLPTFTPAARNRHGKGNCLLVGDAASLIDPITGEGIYFALRSGELAAQAVGDALRQGTPSAPLYGCSLKGLQRDLLRGYLISKPLFAFPEMCIIVLKVNRDLPPLLKKVIMGEGAYGDVLKAGIKAIPRTIKAYAQYRKALLRHGYRPPGM